MKPDFFSIVGIVACALLIFAGLGLLYAWPLMVLWNKCLVGLIDGIRPIGSIWQAWGLAFLCGILFKPSGFSGSVGKRDKEAK